MKTIQKYISSSPLQTISLCIGCLLIFLASGTAPDAFIYNRQAITQGEIWRLITGHFVHCDFQHLILNICALFLIGSLLEQQAGRRFFEVVSISCLGVSGWLWFTQTHLLNYCGLSGMLNGMLIVLLATLWKRHKHPLIPVIAIASLIKIWIEAAGEQAIFSDLSWASVPGAHGAGIAAGITYLLITKVRAERIPRT